MVLNAAHGMAAQQLRPQLPAGLHGQRATGGRAWCCLLYTWDALRRQLEPLIYTQQKG